MRRIRTAPKEIGGRPPGDAACIRNISSRGSGRSRDAMVLDVRVVVADTCHATDGSGALSCHRSTFLT